MRRLIIAFLSIFALTGAVRTASAEDTLKIAESRRKALGTRALPRLGQRGGIFKKHGLNLDILYTAAGPESIQAMIGGSDRHFGRLRHIRRSWHFCQGRTDPHHFQRDDRRARPLLVSCRRIPQSTRSKT